MRLDVGQLEFLAAAIAGSWLIARFFASGPGQKVPFPPMVVEIVLGFLLAKLNVTGHVVESPVYLLGEVGVVAVIAAGGTHAFAAGGPALVRRGAAIALLGVGFSLVLASGVLFAFGHTGIGALVVAIALAPSSAGVATRVLVARSANHAESARTFFVTAVLDDMLGLVALALVEIVLLGGAGAIAGLLYSVASAALAIAGFRWVRSRQGSARLEVWLWVAIGLAALLGVAVGASPVVVAFSLAAGTSPVLGRSKVTAKIQAGGFVLLPLFFISLGAIAGSYPAAIASALPIALCLAAVAALAKMGASRLVLGTRKYLPVGAMLAPRAEITFVIALAGNAAHVVGPSDVFVIALASVALAITASVWLDRTLGPLLAGEGELPA